MAATGPKENKDLSVEAHELILAAQRGSMEAFKEAFVVLPWVGRDKRRSAYLVWVMRRILTVAASVGWQINRDSAEDIAQEFMVELWQKLPLIHLQRHPDTVIIAWGTTVIFRLVRRHHRLWRNGGLTHVSSSAIPQYLPLADCPELPADLNSPGVGEMACEFENTLSGEQQKLFSMMRQGWKAKEIHREIAKTSPIILSTVYKRMACLRHLWEKYYKRSDG